MAFTETEAFCLKGWGGSANSASEIRRHLFPCVRQAKLTGDSTLAEVFITARPFEMTLTVDNVPESSDVFGPSVLVLEVISMLWEKMWRLKVGLGMIQICPST